MVEAGTRGGFDEGRGRKVDGGQMGDTQFAGHGRPPAAWRPAMKPKVSAGPRLMPPAG